MKIVLLLRSLETGGSERQAATLAAALSARGHRVHILTFYGGGALVGEVAKSGATMVAIGKKGRWDILGFMVRLIAALRAFAPDVVYSFLPGANVIASAAVALAGGLPLVWGVRCAEVDLSQYGRPIRFVYWLERLLCRHPRLIIANSRRGADALSAQGFPRDRIAVVPNGIDTVRFQPDDTARRLLRSQWGITDGQVLVGIAARLDPVKDHVTFLRAAARLVRRGDIRFICVGPGPAAFQAQLMALANSLGLHDRLTWAGAQTNMPAVYSAFDIATLTSTSEGFPNGIAEAMACGIPCVSTDAGDADSLIGDTGTIVPVGDEAALADAWSALADAGSDKRAEMGRRARRRIEHLFGTGGLAERSEQLLANAISRP